MKFTFAPEATPLAGYTIKRAIDRGGFGEVYYALSDSGKEVALKLLQHNQQIELRGIRQCLNLKHPNLVTIFDIKTDEDEDHWVVMEYVSGKSLEQVLDENPGGLPIEEVEGWLSGIAGGIGFLHDRGIVHRDLKPANVFRENGVVKIGDVGLSKFITPSRRSAQTESVGTVYYMAPEVARGKYGSELDIYSLGVILFEMLTGRVPFDGESTGEILMKHLTEAPDLSKLPPALRPVIARALEKDPQKRTPSAGQLAEDFRRAVQGKPVAQEVPASHFVDVERLERKVALESPSAARRPDGYGVNGNGHYGHQSAGRGQAAAPVESARRGFSFVFDEVRRKPWLAAALVIVSLVFLPGGERFLQMNLRGGLRLILPAAFIYVIVWGIRNAKRLLPGFHSHSKRGGPGPSDDGTPHVRPAAFGGGAVQSAPVHAPPRPPAPPHPIPVVIPVRQEPPKPPPPKVQPIPTPNTPREIPLRTRLSDVTAALTLAVFWSVAATALVGLAASFWPVLGPVNVGLTEPARAGLFAITTILAAWSIILPSKFWEGSGPETSGRRLIATALGAAVGACAWWLGQALWVEPLFESVFPGLFNRVFQYPLLSHSHSPTLAGYVTFFAALFALRRWWWQADSFRPNKFRVRSFLWSGVVAFLVPALFVFPQGWGVSWALAISAVVHLSAPWTEPKQRLALVQTV